MSRAKKRRANGADPLLSGCATCGALKGQGCREISGDPPPELVSIATRLVHRARTEGDTNA